jgi:hypothetical protein
MERHGVRGRGLSVESAKEGKTFEPGPLFTLTRLLLDLINNSRREDHERAERIRQREADGISCGSKAADKLRTGSYRPRDAPDGRVACKFGNPCVTADVGCQ